MIDQHRLGIRGAGKVHRSLVAHRLARRNRGLVAGHLEAAVLIPVRLTSVGDDEVAATLLAGEVADGVLGANLEARSLERLDRGTIRESRDSGTGDKARQRGRGGDDLSESKASALRR